MTRWYGKVLGFAAGMALGRNPVAGLVGLLIGHAFDANWFKPDVANPYREFGLAGDASDAEVDAAYKRLISQYHPDKYVGAAPELREQAEKRARELNAAYDRIRKSRKK